MNVPVGLDPERVGVYFCLMQWYYSVNGERIGPVDVEEMDRLRADKTVVDSTMVWREGLAKWMPWRDASPEEKPVAEDEVFWFEGQRITPQNKRDMEQRLREGTFGDGVLIPARLAPRFWAYMIDSIIAYLPFTLVDSGREFSGLQLTGGVLWGYIPVLIVLLVVLPAVYEVWMVTTYRATLGKMIFNLEIVDEGGEPIAGGRSFGRYCGKLFLGSCVSFLPYAAVWFTDKKQAAHDMLCNTVVVQR